MPTLLRQNADDVIEVQHFIDPHSSQRVHRGHWYYPQCEQKYAVIADVFKEKLSRLVAAYHEEQQKTSDAQTAAATSTPTAPPQQPTIYRKASMSKCGGGGGNATGSCGAGPLSDFL